VASAEVAIVNGVGYDAFMERLCGRARRHRTRRALVRPGHPRSAGRLRPLPRRLAPPPVDPPPPAGGAGHGGGGAGGRRAAGAHAGHHTGRGCGPADRPAPASPPVERGDRRGLDRGRHPAVAVEALSDELLHRGHLVRGLRRGPGWVDPGPVGPPAADRSHHLPRAQGPGDRRGPSMSHVPGR
jgi:hypothetical protein